MSQDLRALPESRRKARHAGRGHRGPDTDLIVEAGLIFLFMIVYGGFFTALFAVFGV